MDGFSTFNTANRKKFLDQAKKKKDVTLAQKINPEHQVTTIRLQATIRAFLQIKKLSAAYSQQLSTISLISLSSEQILNLCQCFSELNGGSLFRFNRMHKNMICELCKIQSQRINLIQSKYSPLIGLLGSFAQSIQSIFDVLSRKQKQFWVVRILPLSTHFSLTNLNERKAKALSRIINEKVCRLIQIFGSIQSNIKLIQQLLHCAFQSDYFTNHMSQQQESQHMLPYKKAYINITHIISLKKIDQMGPYPLFILYVLKILINALYKQNQKQLMQKYNINEVLLKAQGDLLEQVLFEKEQWQNFIEFLGLNSIFIKSVIQWFVDLNQNSFEISLGCCDLISTIIPLTPIGFSLKLTIPQLMNILEKLNNWVKTHEIGSNLNQQRILLSFLQLVKETFFEMTNLEFVNFIKQEGQVFLKILKDKLIPIIYKIVSLRNTSKIIDKITKACIQLLEDIYNKIFRTGVVSTQIFVNEALTSRLLSNNKDIETSDFLAKFPFVFSLKTRAKTFRDLVIENYANNQHFYHEGLDKNILIRRGYEFEDAFNQLKNKDMRKMFKIVFINKFGGQEIGVDMGGLTKEFLNRVLKAAFKPQFGMFLMNSKKQLLPHPQKSHLEEGTIAEYYQFIGKLIGRALFQGITIGPKFCGPFLNAIIGKKNNFDDLQQIDNDLYKSLVYIKTMEEDARQLELTFQFKDQSTKKLINLKRNGKQIKVDNHNKQQYVNLLANYKVNRLLEYQSRFIRRGLKKIINSQWLFMFNYAQLNYLISGSGEIKIYELKHYTRYVNYSENSPTIQMFWSILEEFDEKSKSKLLQFVTSCPRPSFLGFSDMKPPFTITKTNNVKSLPVSHTCSNLLELPDYQNRQVMKEKLEMAINSESGFDIA